MAIIDFFMLLRCDIADAASLSLREVPVNKNVRTNIVFTLCPNVGCQKIGWNTKLDKREVILPSFYKVYYSRSIILNRLVNAKLC